MKSDDVGCENFDLLTKICGTYLGVSKHMSKSYLPSRGDKKKTCTFFQSNSELKIRYPVVE